MDQRSSKLTTMQKALHPRDDTDILYVSRRGGGKGLISIEDCIGLSIQGLKNDNKKSKEKLIKATNNSIGNISTERKTLKKKWEEKQLYQYFKRQTSEIAHKKIWTWL